MRFSNMPITARKTMRRTIPWAITLALLLVLSGALYAWAATETVTYSYDDTYQVTGASYDGRAAAVAYVYDDAGNRQSKTTTTTDTTPPVSAITDPADNATISGTSYTVTGVSSDAGIGVATLPVFLYKHPAPV